MRVQTGRPLGWTSDQGLAAGGHSPPSGPPPLMVSSSQWPQGHSSLLRPIRPEMAGRTSGYSETTPLPPGSEAHCLLRPCHGALDPQPARPPVLQGSGNQSLGWGDFSLVTHYVPVRALEELGSGSRSASQACDRYSPLGHSVQSAELGI